MLTADEYREHQVGIDYGDDVDWWEELVNDNNFSQKHNLSIDLGTENARMYASFFYQKNEGTTSERKTPGCMLRSFTKRMKV